MDILQRATQLLAPFMGEDRRDTWLTFAFHEHRGVYDAIQKTGATADFTVRCVSQLLDRGCVGSRHALSVLLDVVRSQAGDDKQEAFQALIEELDRRCIAARRSAPALQAALGNAPQEPPQSVSASAATVSRPSDRAPRPVFISYAHADNEAADPAKRWLDRLKQHLEPLVQQDSIAICSDQDIDLGEDWHEHIQTRLTGAQAAVLLVSPAFLASKYIRNSELPVLLRYAKERGVKVIPVILRPCLFEETRFKYPDPTIGPEEFTLASLQAAGSPKRALSEMSEGEQDRALLKVAQALANLVAVETGQEETSSREASEDPLTAYRQSLLRDLSQRYQIDTRFVRLRLLDMVRSEHAVQFKERPKDDDYTDLREVLTNIPERAMVLLGAPGCGKSTLLRRLQLDDAQDRLADGGDRVSLFVSLGAYPLDRDPAKDAPRPLDWLKAQWRRQAPDLPDLETLLRNERVLLLLDALNEMPHRNAADFRERVEQWRCFLRDDFPPGNQAVFSCRSLDYSETLSVKDDLDVRQVRVQPLTPEQIEEFLHLYAPDHAGQRLGRDPRRWAAAQPLQHAVFPEASHRPARIRPAGRKRARSALHRLRAPGARARDRRTQSTLHAGWRARGARPRPNCAALVGQLI
jgi:NACHT domain/TIR domain/Effector-associated domain 8